MTDDNDFSSREESLTKKLRTLQVSPADKSLKEAFEALAGKEALSGRASEDHAEDASDVEDSHADKVSRKQDEKQAN